MKVKPESNRTSDGGIKLQDTALWTTGDFGRAFMFHDNKQHSFTEQLYGTVVYLVLYGEEK
jgi:hypothetical protein